MPSHERPLLLLSTCGTSLLTNGADAGTRRWLVQRANARELPSEEQARLDAHASARGQALLAASPAERRRLSAECNGIAACLERWKPPHLHHLLLHTDTAVGRAAAEAVAAALRAGGATVELRSARDLQTANLLGFRAALSELVRDFEAELPGYRERGWRVVFNLTGGFKSLNAFLQALAMIYADAAVFLFESSTEAMIIPRLPVQLAQAEVLRRWLDPFRRMALDLDVPASAVEGLPGTLWDELDGQAAISVWGRVFWNREYPAPYRERLLPSPSPLLVYTPTFEKSVAGLPPDRVRQVNETIDELARHLEGGRPLLASSQMKSLQGRPHPRATHEVYAWSDGSAGRLLGHFEGERFVIDALVKHL